MWGVGVDDAEKAERVDDGFLVMRWEWQDERIHKLGDVMGLKQDEVVRAVGERNDRLEKEAVFVSFFEASAASRENGTA